MKNITPKKWWIELEVWLVDYNGYPIYKKKEDEESSYDRLVNHRRPDQNSVKQEVINNMVEMVTKPHASLEAAKNELDWLLTECRTKSQELWMNLSQIPRVCINEKMIDKEKIIEHCVTDRDYYKLATQQIIELLKNPYDLLWAGCLATHIHMSAENDEATLHLFKKISNHANKIRNKWLNTTAMYMHPRRYKQRNNIIEAREKLGHLVSGIHPENIPDDHIPHIYSNYFDKDGQLKRMHNIIAIKKPGENYTVELRSMDWVCNRKWLENLLYFAEKLVYDATK